MPQPHATFTGFRPATFSFFRGLARHNDPNWFKPRKAVYDAEVVAPLRALIAAVGAALDAVGIPLVGDPARGLFRIYRDVRFSANKQLYKTHAAAVLTRSGGKRDPGLLYLHVEPGQSLAGIGFWHPEPELMTRLRRSILDDADRFLAVIDGVRAQGLAVSCENERLSRPPRGFESARGGPVADYVCWKNFIAERTFDDAEMQSPDLVGRIVDFALAARPLLDWGWEVADGEAPPPLVLKMPARPLPKPDF